MNLLRAYFAYAKDPAHALRELTVNRRFGAAMAGYVTAALSYLVFFNVGAQLGAWAFAAKFLVLLLLELTTGYFIASLSGLFLDFGKHKGAGGDLFILVGLSGFIKSMLVAFALTAGAWPWLQPVGALVILLAWACQFAFIVRGLRRVYDISLGKAVGALLFAAVPLAAVGALALASFIWLIALI